MESDRGMTRRDFLDSSVKGTAVLGTTAALATTALATTGLTVGTGHLATVAAEPQIAAAPLTDRILVARTILTMEAAQPRATAVAISGGKIAAVGTLADCKAALPAAEVIDLGETCLMPGFIETHGHTLLSGMSTKAPATYIAPWLVPTWDEIVALGKKAAAEAPAGHSLCFFGLDRLLHGCEFPNAKQMDEIFGDRIACMIALSQHQASVTTATLKHLGWDKTPPADPVGGTYGRLEGGNQLDGIAHEIPAVLPLIAPIFAALGGHPLEQAALYMAEMASVGITATSDIGYTDSMLPAYEALARMPHVPMRVALYHQTVEPTCDQPLKSTVSTDLLRKNGMKFWADGSPWLGSIATSFPYLDSPEVRAAGIVDLHPGLKAMNYTQEQLDNLLDQHAASGWQIACHANGDLTLELVLDAFERALKKYKLLGTDHRWRLEHVGAVRLDQLERMKALGVIPTFGVFQMMQWGDLLDGKMYDSQYGARWCPTGDAERLGIRQSYHNDGNISRPDPLASVRASVTRKSNSGNVHGPDQKVSLDEGLRAITIHAAHIMKLDDVIGSVEVGKFADFAQLSADPHSVSPDDWATKVKVVGTWLGGQKIDLAAFTAAAGETHPDDHSKLRDKSCAACGCSSRKVQMG